MKKVVLQVNTDVVDRFKVFDRDHKLVMKGQKRGDRTSFFDAFITSAYAKLAQYELVNLTNSRHYLLHRLLEDDLKRYDVEFQGETVAAIECFLKGENPNFHLVTRGIERNFEVPYTARRVEVEGLGQVEILPWSFKAHREFSIESYEEVDLEFMTIFAIFIWNTLIRHRKAFV